MPKVSVLIPVYNTEKYIAHTINSILNQTYQDWELVIVDDCSTDNTFQICQQYAQQEPRIRLFKNAKNLGMMPNWNHGISLCQGKYWGKLDADDWWHEKMLEDCVNILDTMPEVGLVCSRHINIDEDGNVIANSVPNPPDFVLDQVFDFGNFIKLGNDLLQFNIAKQGIGLLRSKIFTELGLFTLLDAGDTEMWFRIGSTYQLYCINQVYHYHRVWNESFTRQKVLKINKLEKNLFDVREAIFNYYYSKGKISSMEYQEFMNKNRFAYNKFLIAQNFKDKKYKQAWLKLWQNLLISPSQTIAFYFRRFKEKIIL
ncbi:MAG: glycosyltransferase family 2 protein [Microscillaceae bacterium]|jgi:glycosyltransferase involved in cell wall biosynthesis|nr:glycosyltransferase family 2 protein [Microscillaceae bacterium]